MGTRTKTGKSRQSARKVVHKGIRKPALNETQVEQVRQLAKAKPSKRIFAKLRRFDYISPIAKQ